MLKDKKILIVGAGGFSGSFLAAEGVARGAGIWAGVRSTTSRKWLTQPGLQFLELDFSRPETLAGTLRDALPEGERWDYIIYNLGATKCLNFSDFNLVNHDYLRYFTEALKEAGKVPLKLLYMSSLSVMGPGDEKGFTPFSEKMVPAPNTRYGVSKLKAETWLATSGIPHIIFRPTGIYGPRDRDYFLMFESINRGFDFSVGFRPQTLTFIYAADLARAAYDALEKAPAGRTYLLSEDAGYTQKQFRAMAARALGKRLVLPVRLPLWAVKAVSAVAEKWGVARMKPSTLNRDKFRIMKQRNWAVDISAARHDFGFSPRVSLEEGVRLTVDWYRKEGWLK